MTGYLDRIQAAIDSGALTPSGVTQVHVQHDDACQAQRTGVCNCTPEITATVGNLVLVIGHDGDILERRRRQ